MVVGGIFAVTQFVGGSSGKKTATASSSLRAAPRRTPTGATCPRRRPPRWPSPSSSATAPPKTLAAGRTWTATVATTCGPMTFELDGAKAPQTVSSFIYLARKGFFNNTTCHRLVTSGHLRAAVRRPDRDRQRWPRLRLRHRERAGRAATTPPAPSRWPGPTTPVQRQPVLPGLPGQQAADRRRRLLHLRDGQDRPGRPHQGRCRGSARPSIGNTAPNTPINITSVTVK